MDVYEKKLSETTMEVVNPIVPTIEIEQSSVVQKDTAAEQIIAEYHSVIPTVSLWKKVWDIWNQDKSRFLAAKVEVQNMLVDKEAGTADTPMIVEEEQLQAIETVQTAAVENLEEQLSEKEPSRDDEVAETSSTAKHSGHIEAYEPSLSSPYLIKNSRG